MRSIAAGISFVFLTFIASCTRLPDQSDVTHVDITDIIRNVRCETQEHILSYPPDHWINKAIIGYTFTFTSQEDNDGTGNATLVFPIPHGSFTLALRGGYEKTRLGENTVNIGERISNLRNNDCTDARYTTSLRYPIVGYIGTKSVIERFIKIIELRNVASETYSQLLRFQVDINGGVKPSVSILPSAGRVVNADLDFAAERSDVHKLLLILKPPPPPKISEPEKIIKIQIVGDDRDKAARRAPLGPDRPAARQEAPVAPSTRPNTLTPEEQQDLFRSLRRERSLDVEESILDELREQGTLR